MVIRECVLVVLMVVITGPDCDVTGGLKSWFPGNLLLRYQVYLWYRLKPYWVQRFAALVG